MSAQLTEPSPPTDPKNLYLIELPIDEQHEGQDVQHLDAHGTAGLVPGGAGHTC